MFFLMTLNKVGTTSLSLSLSTDMLFVEVQPLMTIHPDNHVQVSEVCLLPCEALLQKLASLVVPLQSCSDNGKEL